MAESYRFKQEVYQLHRHIFAVRNGLGAGWPEIVYHRALFQELSDHGIPVQFKPRRSILHQNQVVHVFEADLIAWNKIILELKVMPEQSGFAGEHFAQVIHYLKAYQMSLGLLVNFAPPKVRTRRVIWDEPDVVIATDYRRLNGGLSSKDRAFLHQIECVVDHIGNTHGLGYQEVLYRKMMLIELATQGLSYSASVEIPAKWRQKVVARHQTPCIMVENDYLIHVSSRPARPSSYDYTMLNTFLRGANLRFGLLINFGYRRIQIDGVSNH